jgi:hypothetical protein
MGVEGPLAHLRGLLEGRRLGQLGMEEAAIAREPAADG